MAETILICVGTALIALGAVGVVLGRFRRRRSVRGDEPDRGRTDA